MCSLIVCLLKHWTRRSQTQLTSLFFQFWLAGIYGLSNSLLDTPWKKLLRGKQHFTSVVNDQNLSCDGLVQELLGVLNNEDLWVHDIETTLKSPRPLKLILYLSNLNEQQLLLVSWFWFHTPIFYECSQKFCGYYVRISASGYKCSFSFNQISASTLPVNFMDLVPCLTRWSYYLQQLQRQIWKDVDSFCHGLV